MGSPLDAANYIFSSVGCRKPKKVRKHCLNLIFAAFYALRQYEWDVITIFLKRTVVGCQIVEIFLGMKVISCKH